MMSAPEPSRSSHQATVSAVPPIAEPEGDSALMRRVVEQDHEAFNTLYGRYTPRLRGYLIRFLGQSELVDEVLNDVMLVMWERATHFDSTALLVPWLIGIARKKAWKALARTSSTIPLAQQEALDEVTPEAEILRQEYDELLAYALQTLPPDQRTVLELLVYQDYSYQEIAERIGHPINTVKTRVFRARRALAARLARFEPVTLLVPSSPERLSRKRPASASL